MSFNILKIKEYIDSYQYSYYSSNDFTSSRCSSKVLSLNNDNSKRSSISRSINTIKDYVKSNKFDYFVTLTLKDGLSLSQEDGINLINKYISNYYRNSLSHLAGCFKKKKQKAENIGTMARTEDGDEFPTIFKLSRNIGKFRRNLTISGFVAPEGRYETQEKAVFCGFDEETSEDRRFKYLYVFELTKKGAIHCHGFFSGFYDLYVNQYGHLSSKYFDKLGFQCFRDSNSVNEFYLIKYITKDFFPFLKQRYFHSRNLDKPKIDKFYDCDNEFLDFCWVYRDKFVSMVTIKK